MPSQKPGQPRAPHPRSMAREQENNGANPRNVPGVPLDPTPQDKLPEAHHPTLKGQDTEPVDAETLLRPPRNAPDVRREGING